MPNTAHILLVDDDEDQLAIIKLILKRAGHNVDTASSATEALDMLAQSKFDTVITDVRMPDMDGIQFVKHLRAVGLEVPVILLTAGESLDETSATSAGANALCVKKFAQQRLGGLVEAILTANEK